MPQYKDAADWLGSGAPASDIIRQRNIQIKLITAEHNQLRSRRHNMRQLSKAGSRTVEEWLERRTERNK